LPIKAYMAFSLPYIFMYIINKKRYTLYKLNLTTMKKLMLIIFSVVLMIGTAQASNLHPKKPHYKNKNHNKFHVPHKRFVDRTYQN
jgi:hypothetical protein